MSEDMPEDMPDHMPEDMLDRMSNRMSEDMSDRMPEDLPVRKCINVMVGITRSKVINAFCEIGRRSHRQDQDPSCKDSNQSKLQAPEVRSCKCKAALFQAQDSAAKYGGMKVAHPCGKNIQGALGRNGHMSP